MKKSQFILQKFVAPPETPPGGHVWHGMELDAPDDDYAFSSWRTVTEHGKGYIVVMWERKFSP